MVTANTNNLCYCDSEATMTMFGVEMGKKSLHEYYHNIIGKPLNDTFKFCILLL